MASFTIITDRRPAHATGKGGDMDVRLIEDAERGSIEVQILCPPACERAEALAERIRMLAGRIVGYEPGRVERRVVPLSHVASIEVGTGSTTCIALRNGSLLETPLRLYELEAALEGTEVVRISRQALVNFDAVRAIRPELNGRLALDLDNGATVIVTRTYVSNIKRKLGMVGR